MAFVSAALPRRVLGARTAPVFGATRGSQLVSPLRAERCLRTASGVRMSSVILAPGQGAQAQDMLSAWVEASPAAAKVVEQADEILGERLQAGSTLSAIVRDAPAETLNRTDIAQPAIFVTSMACWAGMQELGLVSADDVSVTAGLSLGEYTALAIAGAISFEDGLELVTLRGRAMQDAAEASAGGMVALIGADEEVAQKVVEAASLDGQVLVAANFNAPGQVVLSGSMECVDKAAGYASGDLKLRVAKLDVAGAFHSPLMAPAADRLQAALADTTIGLPNMPVMSNVTGEPHVVGKIREMLVKQLTSSVRWADCMTHILETESLSSSTSAWCEVAPGKTLSGIMRKINRKQKVDNFAVPPSVANV